MTFLATISSYFFYFAQNKTLSFLEMTGCQVGLVIEGVLHFENQLAEARLRKLPLISEGSSFAHNDFLRSVAKYESGWLMDFRMRNCLHTTNDEIDTGGRQENSNLLFILIFFSDES